MPNNIKFLNTDGLTRYHEGVVRALNDKASKNHVYIGSTQPTKTDITVWFDTSEEDANVTSNEDQVLLLVNSDDPDEELILEEYESEELSLEE